MAYSSTFKKIIYLFIILFLLSYCATKPEVITRVDESEIVRNRTQEYWQYKIDGKVEKAYQIEAPEFREKVSVIRYSNRFKLEKYLKADISKIEIEGERGKASVNITYVMLLPHFTKKQLMKVEEEDWVKIKGIWYHIPRE